jgi:hypothetical protein
MTDKDYDWIVDRIGTGDVEERIEHPTPVWVGWLAIAALVLLIVFFCLMEVKVI